MSRCVPSLILIGVLGCTPPDLGAEGPRGAPRESASTTQPPGESFDELLVIPHAKPAQLAPFASFWQGTLATPGGSARPMTLELHPVNGCSEGELVLDDPHEAHPLKLLRVRTDGTLEVGYLEGPRLLRVYALRPDGRGLRGERTLRGDVPASDAGGGVASEGVVLERASPADASPSLPEPGNRG
ncbi:MAG: hypothetical protein H6825_10320 [Planctomycetes bacterium]|nr:hypothetical protein [Planctomycetota bacterium]